MRSQWPVRGLYAITPDDNDTRRLLKRTEAVLDEGAVMLQYRNKGADPMLRFEQALGLKLLCLPYGVPLIVNDDIALARAMQADGVHLGEADGSCAAARDELGSDALIGVSCYASLDRARTAASQGADYLAFGAFFDTPTKPGAPRAKASMLHAARSLGRPLIAIGGIRPANVRALRDAGADMVAVISGLWNVPDPRAAARAYVAAFDDTH